MVQALLPYEIFEVEIKGDFLSYQVWEILFIFLFLTPSHHSTPS